MKTLLLQPLERALNKALALDPAKPLNALSGKVIGLCITDWDLRLYLAIKPNYLQLLATTEQPDATMSGTLSTLFKAGIKKQTVPGIRFEGDIHVAHTLQTALSQLNLDWEEALSRVIGDVATHTVAKHARQFARFLKQAHQSLRENTDEFLHEEIRLTPSLAELDSFYGEIATLNLAVDRLAAKLEH